MNVFSYRKRHEFLNELIKKAIQDNSDKRWDTLRALLKMGGGIGHYVASMTKDEGRNPNWAINFQICIYPFKEASELPILWQDPDCRKHLNASQPIAGRVMQRFTDFSDGDTFFHRKIPNPLKESEINSLASSLKTPGLNETKIFDLCDRADLALLPAGTSTLFICPLPVLASPSTFLFFPSTDNKGDRDAQLGLADILGAHFETLLLNNALDGLVAEMLLEIDAGNITSASELRRAFFIHLTSIFMPVSIMREADGNEQKIALADELIAKEGQHKLEIKLDQGKLLLKLIPPSIPDCEAELFGQVGTLCCREGIGQKYASLSKLVSGLYRLLETSLLSFERTQSHNILSQIQGPLKAINEAVSVLQTHAQGLRATLYEPTEVLLKPEVVAPFFQQDIKSLLNLKGIILQHTPDSYDIRTARCVLAGLLCAITGRDEALRGETVIDTFLEIAKQQLNEIENQPYPLRLGAFLELETLTSIFNADLDVLVNALSIAKATFFTPFKGDGKKWQKGAMLFLLEDKRVFGGTVEKRGLLSDNAKTNSLKHLHWSPVSYASVLTFLKNVAEAWRNERRDGKIEFVEWLSDGVESSSLSVGFSQEFLNADDREYLKRLLARVLRLPPEWRLESVNHGDISRSFVMFANRMLRLDGKSMKWEPKRTGKAELLKLCDSKEKQSLIISSTGKVLKVNWTVYE